MLRPMLRYIFELSGLEEFFFIGHQEKSGNWNVDLESYYYAQKEGSFSGHPSSYFALPHPIVSPATQVEDRAHNELRLLLLLPDRSPRQHDKTPEVQLPWKTWRTAKLNGQDKHKATAKGESWLSWLSALTQCPGFPTDFSWLFSFEWREEGQ